MRPLGLVLETRVMLCSFGGPRILMKSLHLGLPAHRPCARLLKRRLPV